MTSPSIPRAEHPRPTFIREEWINLNGPWSFRFDFGKSGMEKGRDLFTSTGFDRTIVVPFCPESTLSGVAHLDFIPQIWYHRTIRISDAWAGRRILLHFGAVDFECEVFVGGVSFGIHYGGVSSFTIDITDAVSIGADHHLVVRAADDTRSLAQPSGKQSMNYNSFSCLYTRTTGIWQTVWMEAVSLFSLIDAQVIPDLDGGRFTIIPRFRAVSTGLTFRVTALVAGDSIAAAESSAANGVPVVVAIPNPHPWSPGDPFLYDLLFEVVDANGRVVDSVQSHTGLRKIHIEGNRLFLNYKPLYLRFVLDQGYYPDGIWTAPSDEALRRDIELSMAAGFNGARLHQKVFEERFHYWADKLGYLTWGEMSSWCCDRHSGDGARNFLVEWQSIVVRDRNHPSIVVWTPWNETSARKDVALHRRALAETYQLSKDLDPTRPVHDTSGFSHYRTDIWSVHTYEQDPVKLAADLTPNAERGVWRYAPDDEVEYSGQPYIVAEYGGTLCRDTRDPETLARMWGHGDRLATPEEVLTVMGELTAVIVGLDHISGFCYTQLTDVEQEMNGIYFYDRTPKFDIERIRSIFGGSQPG